MRYIKPLPINKPLLSTARLISKEQRRWHVEATSLAVRIGRTMLYSSRRDTELGFRVFVVGNRSASIRRVGRARSRVWIWRQGGKVFGFLKKAWMPLLLIVVVAIGAYAVVRIRGSFGTQGEAAGEANAALTEPFNPKRITYEITGSGGSVDVNWLDENGQPHTVDAAPLPWSHTIVTTLPSMSANIVAQGDGGVSGLRCRVIVDGRVRDDRSSDEYQPFIYCIVKSV